jgi:hypothetical protein
VWWRNLGLVHGNNHRQDTNGPTGDESTSNEHTDVDRGSLEGTSDNGNDRTDLDSPLSTVFVGGPTCHESSEEGPGGEQGDNSTDDRGSGSVEVVVEVNIRSGNNGTDDTRVVSEEERSESAEDVSDGLRSCDIHTRR